MSILKNKNNKVRLKYEIKMTYPTKYQLEQKKRINHEIDPLIDQARLSVKSIIADLTESAELKLAKKIKADVVIKELEKAIKKELEIKQRKAQTFFGKISNKELKEKLSYKFDKNDRQNYYRSNYNNGMILKIAEIKLENICNFWPKKRLKKPLKVKKVKELELYKQSAINSVFECGVPDFKRCT